MIKLQYDYINHIQDNDNFDPTSKFITVNENKKKLQKNIFYFLYWNVLMFVTVT